MKMCIQANLDNADTLLDAEWVMSTCEHQGRDTALHTGLKLHWNRRSASLCFNRVWNVTKSVCAKHQSLLSPWVMQHSNKRTPSVLGVCRGRKSEHVCVGQSRHIAVVDCQKSQVWWRTRQKLRPGANRPSQQDQARKAKGTRVGWHLSAQSHPEQMQDVQSRQGRVHAAGS